MMFPVCVPIPIEEKSDTVISNRLSFGKICRIKCSVVLENGKCFTLELQKPNKELLAKSIEASVKSIEQENKSRAIRVTETL